MSQEGRILSPEEVSGETARLYQANSHPYLLPYPPSFQMLRYDETVEYHGVRYQLISV